MIFIIYILIYLTLIPAKTSLATNEFIVKKDIDYQFSVNGDANVTQKIKLTNRYSTIYPKEYQLTIHNQNITNLSATDERGNVIKDTSKSQDTITVFIQFNSPSINTQTSTDFQIKYTIPNLAQNIGNLWKVDIPKHQSDNSSDIINISAPLAWGDLAYSSITPNVISKNDQFQTFQIPSQYLSNNISFAFGQTQLFNFKLDYLLRNEHNQVQKVSIPIPPDTDSQTIFFQDISPTPQNVTLDLDGNYLASYQLDPKQELSILVTGQAQIHPRDTNFPQIKPQNFHLAPSKYWPDHPTLKNYAQNLKSARKIYDFVIDKLEYDSTQITNANRKSPLSSLANPTNSLCTDFTDLFISISRLASIPSREIQGFVYTQDPKLQSQLIKGDLLHAWPQFWNQSGHFWQSIDPTWQKTSDGTDYFNSIDLNRIILVFHGQDSQHPLAPGSYKNDPDQKTVNITPTNKPLVTTTLPTHIRLEKNRLIITNPNLHTLTNLDISVAQYKFEDHLDILPPLSTFSTDLSKLNHPLSVFPSNKNISVSITSSQNKTNQVIANPYHQPYALATTGLLLLSLLGGIIVLKKIP